MISTLLLLLALGAIVGVLAGLLGIGGGLVLVAGLIWLLPAIGIAEPMVVHTAIGTALATMVVTASVATFKHHRRRAVLWQSVATLAPGLLIGTAMGSLLAASIDGRWLAFGVSAYCFVAAAQLVLGQPRMKTDGNATPTGARLATAGSGIGVVSALVGIGGGSMTVPTLIWLGAHPVRAIATSSACGLVIAIAGTVAYALLGGRSQSTGPIGFVHFPAAVAVAVGSAATAPLGVRLAHRLTGRSLKLVFASFLVLLGLVLVLNL